MSPFLQPPRAGANEAVDATLAQLIRTSARLAAQRRPPARNFARQLAQKSWPYRVHLKSIYRLLRRHETSDCRADGGPGALRQALDMWRLAARHPLAPSAYHRYRLYRPELAPIAGQFVDFDMLAVVEGAILDARHADRVVLTDKRRFAKVCAEHGVPTVPVLAWCEGGNVREAQALPEADLFSKPGNWKNGRGASLWWWQGNGRWSDGRASIDGTGLLAELARRSIDGPQMLQRRVVNHPDLASFSSGGVSTARIVTLRFPGMPSEHLASVFKMTSHGGAADNFKQGGLLAPIDPVTGELGAALVKKTGHARQRVHPDSGATIPGMRLPCWRETLALCLATHDRLFERYPGVGWDVAITPEGPLFIEGNWNWDPALMQVGHGAPLGVTRLPACYLAHVADLRL